MAFGARNEASELGVKLERESYSGLSIGEGPGGVLGEAAQDRARKPAGQGGRGDQNAGDGGSERMTTPWEEGLGERGAFQKSRRATRSCDF